MTEDQVDHYFTHRKGLTGAQAEYAVQKYKSHRCIKMGIFES